MHRRRAVWAYESVRELLVVAAGSAMLVLGAASVVAMSVGAAAS
jgi:hypothetical protein